MTSSARALLRTVKAALPDGSALDARWLVGLALGRDQAVFAHETITLNRAQQAELARLITLRSKGCPVSRLRGKREFYDLLFHLNEHTLDPRPDSECLVDQALIYARTQAFADQTPRCLDVGTGTGCLLLSLLHHLPGATGLGIDLAPLAVAQARANAAHLNLSRRSRFICGHWLSAVNTSFDLILANPPYIGSSDHSLAPDVADYDPALALYAGPDGLSAYAALLPQISRVLTRNGRLFLEIGAGQAEPVTQLALAAGLKLCAVQADLSGIDRCLILAKI